VPERRSLGVIRSHYDVLGIDRRADAAAIRDAYRDPRPHGPHPTARDGSADEMAAVNEAYRVLSDPGPPGRVRPLARRVGTTGATGIGGPPVALRSTRTS
jgi:hypothetical protein